MWSAFRLRTQVLYIAGVVLAVLLAPVLLFVADPLRRLASRDLTWRQLGRREPFGWHEVATGPPPVWASLVIRNPVVIALGAPYRWLRGHLFRSRQASPPPWLGGPPPAGVREPRRPGPTPPADQITLPEPHE